jgi:hypothetical protein
MVKNAITENVERGWGETKKIESVVYAAGFLNTLFNINLAESSYGSEK